VGYYDYFVALGDEALGEAVYVHFDAAEARVEEVGYQSYLHFRLSLGGKKEVFVGVCVGVVSILSLSLMFDV